jgi:hypothetical protein
VAASFDGNITMTFTNEYLENAHKRSIFNVNEIQESKICGCFFCLAIFPSSDIVEWCDDDNPKGKTALCPKCGIDSVIGSASGYPIDDPEFLKASHNKYF